MLAITAMPLIEDHPHYVYLMWWGMSGGGALLTCEEAVCLPQLCQCKIVLRLCWRWGGREGGREGERKGGREGGREGGRKGGRERRDIIIVIHQLLWIPPGHPHCAREP